MLNPHLCWGQQRGSLGGACWRSLTPVLTINISPESMTKWGKSSSHVKNYVKIHLVSLVLVELFVCRKYSKVWPKRWQILTYEASGHGRATWAHRKVSPSPQVAMPHQWSMGAPPQPMESLHSSRFDQGPRFVHGGFMGPLSYTWSSPLT